MRCVAVTIAAWMALATFGLLRPLLGPAYAEEPVSFDPMEILTGGEEREWVATRWDWILNDEAGRCTGGGSWIFRENGTGSRLVCEEGQRTAEAFNWAWQDDLGGENGLIIDRETYLVDLRQQPSELPGEPPILVAILRTPREDQGDPVQEIRLEYWER